MQLTHDQRTALVRIADGAVTMLKKDGQHKDDLLAPLDYIEANLKHFRALVEREAQR